MRNRRPTPEHEEAVARRLALLSAELASVRATPSRQSSQTSAGAPPAQAPEAWPWDEHTRVRPDAHDGGLQATPIGGDVAVGDVAPGGVAPPGAVPVPGRHAARRAATDGGTLVPPALRGRFALQPLHVSVVAIVIAVALVAASWRLARSEPEPIEVRTMGSASSAPVGASAAAGPGDRREPASETETGPVPVASTTGAHASETSSPGQGTAQVTVDVAGRVRRPGIVVLPTGSRVVDALEAAGGARRGVDLTPLNLARLLVDGEQVLVGVGAVPGTAAGVAPTPGSPAGLVNINTADQTLLETLPGVGPVTAGAILGWRDEHGGFSSVDELLEVDGIGDATLETLAPLVTL